MSTVRQRKGHQSLVAAVMVAAVCALSAYNSAEALAAMRDRMLSMSQARRAAIRYEQQEWRRVEVTIVLDGCDRQSSRSATCEAEVKGLILEVDEHGRTVTEKVTILEDVSVTLQRKGSVRVAQLAST